MPAAWDDLLSRAGVVSAPCVCVVVDEVGKGALEPGNVAKVTLHAAARFAAHGDKFGTQVSEALHHPGADRARRAGYRVIYSVLAAA